MSIPKISIIIPVYNTADYLKECFDSIQSQTFKDFEVIVVDDGSTDCSGAICDEYCFNDPRFKVIHKKNEGVSSARNEGLEIAKGDYIYFMDSDDTVLSGMLEEYIHVAKETGADFIQSLGSVISDSTASNIKHPQKWYFKNEEARKEFFTLSKLRPSVWLSFVKRDLIGDLRFPYNIYQWEDYAFLAVLVSRCQLAAITSNRYYNYVIREGSATNRPMNEKHLSCLLINEYLESNNVYKTQQERADVISFFIRCCCLNYLATHSLNKKDYSSRIKREINNNIKYIKISRSVDNRIKIILYAFKYSVTLAIILRFIESRSVSSLLKIRDWLRNRIVK